jgi:glycosyltransferase involved in cell wall biosynthesis
VNEIWVASEYLRDVYRKRVSAPVYVMGQAVETSVAENEYSRGTFGLPEDCFMFLFSFDAGSIVERKNPLATVRAFRQAFPVGAESAILVLKTRNLQACQTEHDRDHWRRVMEIAASDARINIMDRTLSGAELTGLLSTCDCYISLHRSEGFGYGPADAMGLGKPVITTAYSGVTDFCTPKTALLVDYTLQRVPQGAYPYMDESREYYWASPDIDRAAFLMRQVYESPQSGERIGQSGRQLILERYSLAALQRRYVARLSELGWL